MDRFEFDEGRHFAAQLKHLEDDALLDIWEENQMAAAPYLVPHELSPEAAPETYMDASRLPPDFADFMDLALRVDGEDLRGFALPVDMHVKSAAQPFWSSGTGRDSMLMQELQLRGARRCLAEERLAHERPARPGMSQPGASR